MGSPNIDMEAVRDAKAKPEKSPLSMREAREYTKEIFDCSTPTYYRRYYHTIKRYAHYQGPGTQTKRIYKDQLHEAHDEIRDERINGDLSVGE